MQAVAIWPQLAFFGGYVIIIVTRKVASRPNCPSLHNCRKAPPGCLLYWIDNWAAFFVCYNSSMDDEREPLLIRLRHIVRHHWLTLAFVGGFITDFLLLNRVDDVIDNAILSIYVVLATVSLLLFYAGIAQRFGYTWSPRVQKGASIVMQYAYGGLFSGMLIFYGKSGAILSSWPFLFLIIIAILGNELVKNRGQ